MQIHIAIHTSDGSRALRSLHILNGMKSYILQEYLRQHLDGVRSAGAADLQDHDDNGDRHAYVIKRKNKRVVYE